MRLNQEWGHDQVVVVLEYTDLCINGALLPTAPKVDVTAYTHPN